MLLIRSVLATRLKRRLPRGTMPRDWLDGYLSGECGWRPQSLKVSVNHPRYDRSVAAWSRLVWFDFLGTPGLETVELACLPIKPRSKALCKGPIASVPEDPGRLHVSIGPAPM